MFKRFCFFVFFVAASVVVAEPIMTCPECKPVVDALYTEVNSALLVLGQMEDNVQGNIAGGKIGLGHAGTTLQSIVDTSVLPPAGTVESLESVNYWSGRMDGGIATWGEQRYQINNILTSMKTRLDKFECNCSSNCACVPLLESISNYVGLISTTLDDQWSLLSNRLTKIDDFMYDDIAKLVDDYEVTWSSSFTNNAFSWGRLSKWLFSDDDADSAWRQFQQKFDESLANHPETGLSNEGFVGLRQLDTLQKMMYINAAIAEMFSNYHSESNTNDTDLAAITNYLYNVQGPYYQMFNTLNRSGYVPTPFKRDAYNVVTNFFQSPSSRTYSELFKLGHYTNFFSRVELYLMGLNGMFNDSEIISEDEMSQIYQDSQIDHSLGEATNSLSEFASSSSTLTNYINNSWTESITKLFDNISDTSAFSGNDGGARYITFIPSFNIGGFQIEHCDFDMETLRPVINFSNSVFKCIWCAVYFVVYFSFIWFVGTRVFRVMLWLVQFISGSLGN